MDADFWRRKWETGETGFHQAAPNPLLQRHFPALGLARGARIFVPLCGKSLDLAWLAGLGLAVSGAELSLLAVEAFFAEAGLAPRVTEGRLRRFEAGGIVIHQGDVFDLDAAALGPVDAVYDRAALVALPAPLRRRYAAHVGALTGGAIQLLLAYDYDQSRMEGPPFSTPEAEIRALYAAEHTLSRLERREVPGGMRGGTTAWETVWLLGRRG